MANAPSNVSDQLAAATQDAQAGLRVLDSLITTIICADSLRPTEELARLKREAAAYRQAGIDAATT